MKHLFVVAIFIFLVSGCATLGISTSEETLEIKAIRIARENLLIDGHIDLPLSLRYNPRDISVEQKSGEFDYSRARRGGLDAPFCAVYTPARYEQLGGAKALADSIIDVMEAVAAAHPDKFRIARTADDVEKNFSEDRISFVLAMENGTPIEGSLDNLRHFAQRGIRYITLSHSKDNHISDSSGDTLHTWNGLSPFGEQVVREMNRLGVMVDVAHVSDSAAFDALRLSAAPVIVSHTACRYFTPGFERNISDTLIRAVAAKGGIIMVAFGSWFLDNEFRLRTDAIEHELDRYVKEHHLRARDSAAIEYERKLKTESPLPIVSYARIADHIDHIVKLVGIDYVGFGSDFEGVDSLPERVPDVSAYPVIIADLLQRGYSEDDLAKLSGKNMLRVMRAVEHVAEQPNTK